MILRGRKVRLKADGSIATLGSILKFQSGWEYIVHAPDGSAVMVRRNEFTYIKKGCHEDSERG